MTNGLASKISNFFTKERSFPELNENTIPNLATSLFLACLGITIATRFIGFPERKVYLPSEETIALENHFSKLGCIDPFTKIIKESPDGSKTEYIDWGRDSPFSLNGDGNLDVAVYPDYKIIYAKKSILGIRNPEFSVEQKKYEHLLHLIRTAKKDFDGRYVPADSQ